MFEQLAFDSPQFIICSWQSKGQLMCASNSRGLLRFLEETRLVRPAHGQEGMPHYLRLILAHSHRLGLVIAAKSPFVIWH